VPESGNALPSASVGRKLIEEDAQRPSANPKHEDRRYVVGAQKPEVNTCQRPPKADAVFKMSKQVHHFSTTAGNIIQMENLASFHEHQGV
jgi:hypothetical protein